MIICWNYLQVSFSLLFFKLGSLFEQGGSLDICLQDGLHSRGVVGHNFLLAEQYINRVRDLQCSAGNVTQQGCFAVPEEEQDVYRSVKVKLSATYPFGPTKP